MSDYVFHFTCPRCNYRSMLTLPAKEPAPLLNCPDCLINKVDVVELTIIQVDVVRT